MNNEIRMKLSELQKHITEVMASHGDLDVAITLPGWMIGAEDPDSLQHAWEFGIYVLDLVDTLPDGTKTKERIASLGHIGDYESNEQAKRKHLSVVKDS